MSDSDKPFACPTSGCNMSFTNEDHLTVHKKKHDMSLNFGVNGKGNVFFADQTPTPTRFIRNCEEVGLFQDLQSVNPFEETFRRAVEAGKNGTLAASGVSISDDTLHTPHIFPHVPDVASTTEAQILPDTTVQTPQTANIATKTSLIEGKNNLCETDPLANETESSLDVPFKGAEKPIVVNDVSHKDVSTTTSPQLSTNEGEIQLLLKTVNGKLMQLSTIPVNDFEVNCNNKSTELQQMVTVKTEPPLWRYNKSEPRLQSSSSSITFAKMKLKQVLMKNNSDVENRDVHKSKTIHGNGEKRIAGNVNRVLIDKRKKQEILERNRASSMRARAKRKAWIQELEKTVNNVNEANAILQMEVKLLRAEVAKLKTLLLAHEDCSVTKEMEKGNKIVMTSRAVPVTTQITQGMPIPKVTTSKRVTLQDVPIAPKKKLCGKPKNPTILPKVQIQDTTVKNVTELKLVDVSHFVTETDSNFKPIIIVPSDICDTSTRQIIRINPVLEMDNVASKSIGT